MDDALRNFLQLIGFPTWALVVAWGVLKVSSMFRELVERLTQNHVDVEKRLVLLEEIAKRHDKALDKLEQMRLSHAHNSHSSHRSVDDD